MAESRRIIDIAPAAIVRVIAAVVVIWLWLQLWQLLMIVLVAVVLAITLHPLVERLEHRGIPCGVGATGVVLLLTALIVGFFWVTGASLGGQARTLGGRVNQVEREVIDWAPPWMAATLRKNGADTPDLSLVAGYAINTGRLVLGAVIVSALALILTIYLLIEGRQTYAWLVAYAPPAHRARVDITAREARRAILAYAIGNVATSVFAATFVLVSLSLLHVPAAFAARDAGRDLRFRPGPRFHLFGGPRCIARAVGVSSGRHYRCRALRRVPRARELLDRAKGVWRPAPLSNLAVILAFAVGAEVGGIVGALLALPIAAMYPVVESVWLKEYLGREAVESHRRIERRGA
jgi:predicted PurR-regulated permease PerM